MKKIILFIVVLGIVTLFGILLNKNVSVTGTETSKSVDGINLHKATLSIEGMWCSSCAVGAEYNLKEIDGVTDAYINYSENLGSEGWVLYDDSKVDKKQIINAIKPYEAIIVSDVLHTK